MNLNDKTKGIAEAGVITVLAVVLALMGIYLFSIVLILFPIPFIILGFKRSIRYSILSIIVTSLILSMIVDLFTGIFLLLLFGLLAVAFIYLFKRREKTHKILIVTTTIFFLSILLVIVIMGYVLGINFVEYMELSLHKAFEIQLDLMKNISLTNYEKLKIKNMMDLIINYTIAILPSVFIVISGVVSYINYLTSASILQRIMGYRNINIPQFKYFRLPNNSILGILVMFLATLLIKNLGIFHYQTIFLNILIIVLFIFFMQGLSVIVFYIDKHKITKFIKGVVLILSVIYAPMWLFVSLVGFIDSVINFRRIKIS